VSPTSDPTRAGNPFSTRYVRPGAISYVFPEGHSSERLVERLRANGWRGQIVGAHGSGKSALLATLIPAIERAGRAVVHVALHNGQRRLPPFVAAALGEHDRGVLAIDGYEQLGWLGRRGAWRLARRPGWGLLVTCHVPVRLPVLWRTSIDASVARRIVGQLLGGDWSQIAPERVDAALARHGDNLREALFELYDVCQTKGRGARDEG